MFSLPLNAYADWRQRSGLVTSLHEDSNDPPERLLQAVWFHQRLLREKLKTDDGRPVQVLHPGFWNREAGPDFRGAVLRFGSDAPCTGDIELDLQSNDWRSHRHDSNPAFRNVILHVVWEGGNAEGLPTLPLQPVLDSSISELALWLGSDSAQSFPPELLGRCSTPLRDLPPSRSQELLHQAALIRFHSKAAHFQARAREAGWEQALWEGLFRALGYKQNQWPMQRLGELRSRLAGDGEGDPLTLQARLLGTAGILPDDVGRVRRSNDQYLRALWDCWWRERESFGDCILPRSLWKFSGIRPANHPQRRLALAAYWMMNPDLTNSLEEWCARRMSANDQLPTLLKCLQVSADEFWCRHWTLNSGHLKSPQALLGTTRVTDLAVNVILPWLWVRAVEGRNKVLREELERRFFDWPSAEDNTVLRLARARLLSTSSARSIRGAAAQQGLLQIVKDFCENTNATCAECQFPQLVRNWPR